ncbi:type III ribulose-bisphosphate carboxylase [Candidatus Pacearchaeota archaeon]|nr:type III ribulose-bisphosphate carboxylase [Candidatus Pacearchaeota archaeon]
MRDYEYLKLGYEPRNNIVCLFRIEPAKGLSVIEAAKNVALESSTGTWTKVGTEKSYMNALAAKVFSIKGNLVKIAYPSALFERGNVPNILSSVAGNIFGMKAVKNLRLEDISFPKSIIKGFKGPVFGTKGIRKIMKIKNRPLLGTIIKPKLGLKTKDHAKSAYESWIGGCDFVKDDENLASQKFNEFEERVARTLEKANKAEEETGERKAYLVNVTAETNEMLRRAQLVKELGGKFIMVDIITAGFAGLQTLRNANLKLAIHAHRAMHAAMTRNPKHGIRMIVLADFARLIGVDSLHIGTGIGKLEGSISDVHELEEEIEKDSVRETQLRLKQDWHRIKPVLGVCSGGLHPGHFPYLIRHLGKDIILQCGGGIHGHPSGSMAGARAARQAIEATMQGISLKEYSKNHLELREALEKFEKAD